MKSKYLVEAADYNGHKNILFMMDMDDERVNNGNYKSISTDCFYNKKNKTLIDFNTKKTYNVFEDWSVKEI
jgi:hypothetical protein